MALNIKNSEAERALRDLMGLTGETQAAAVEKSARERLARLTSHDHNADINRLVKQVQQAAREAEPGITADELYDDNGLPA